MPRRARSTRKPDKDDLRSFQRFSGTLSDGDRSIPMRFKARIGEDGEVELDIHAFRITKANWFVRERFQDRGDVAEFVLNGVTADGLRFESDSLSFNSLGSRFSGIPNRHWSKPRGECGKVQYFRTISPARERPVLKLHLKGFDCFPPLYATCALGKIQVAGETTLSEADRLTGWIVIEADEPPADIGVWRAEAEKFAEHVGYADMTFGSTFKFLASTMLPLAFIKKGRTILSGHEDDLPNDEDWNLIGWPFARFGYTIRSIQSYLIGTLLTFKIERPVFDPLDTDTQISLNAISAAPLPLTNFAIEVEEAKLGYLKQAKAGSLAKADLSNVTTAELQRLIAERINQSYIYRLYYRQESNVATFNIIIELPGSSGPVRLLASLEYKETERTLRLVTLY